MNDLKSHCFQYCFKTHFSWTEAKASQVCLLRSDLHLMIGTCCQVNACRLNISDIPNCKVFLFRGPKVINEHNGTSLGVNMFRVMTCTVSLQFNWIVGQKACMCMCGMKNHNHTLGYQSFVSAGSCVIPPFISTTLMKFSLKQNTFFKRHFNLPFSPKSPPISCMINSAILYTFFQKQVSLDSMALTLK